MLYRFDLISVLFIVLGPRGEVWFLADPRISQRNISRGKFLSFPRAQTLVFLNVLVLRGCSPLCFVTWQFVSQLQLLLLVFLPLPEAFLLNLATVRALSPKRKANLGLVVYEGLLALTISDFMWAPNCHCNEAIFNSFPQMIYFSSWVFSSWHLTLYICA